MKNQDKKSEDWIPVFKAGMQKDSQGRIKNWTEEDLDKIANTYNSSNHDAPIVIGHPSENKPAWGWVKRNLRRMGKTLEAQFRDVFPEFGEMVNKKMFPKRSISLYPDLLLRHIGFLGAIPPAVKGLPDFQFNDIEENIFLFEFEENKEILYEFEKKIKAGGNEMDPKDLKIQELEAKISEFEEKEKAAVIKMQEENQKKLQELANQIKEKEQALAEHNKTLETLKKEVSAKDKIISEKDAEARKKEHNDFGDKYLTKITPKWKPFVIDFLEFCDGKEYEFSEGTEKTVKTRFKEFVENLPEQITTDEIATKQKASDRQTSFKSVYDSENIEVDAERLELHNKALDYMETHKGINYISALKEISKEGN